MGCICSKGAKSHRYEETDGNEKELKLSKSSKNLSTLSKRNATLGVEAGGNDTASLISNNAAAVSGSTPVSSDEGDQKLVDSIKVAMPQLKRGASVNTGATVGQTQVNMPAIISMPNGEKGAQVVAGWPTWLVAVAGEAINGWVPRKADSFEKMDKIGQGTYSSVYKAREVESNKLVALKKVRFTTMDPESIRFMAREIIVLRRLDHPNVMKLEGLITSRASGSVYLIFEYMEHDLAGLASTSGIKFTEAQIKCYMQQLLSGLDHCHSRGILHRDIKGSNLLIDSNGILKIGDFGLATIFSAHQKQALTSRVVTLWYRPPELLLGATNYGVAVDLWSTGCILAELFAGKPIMPGRTEVEQLHKIFKLCGSPSEEYWKRSKLPHATIFKPQHPYKRCVRETFNKFPSSTLALLDILLAVEPELRGTTISALQSEFFTTNPRPCDPSTLPRYPPSKEFDVKARNEATRRRRAADSKGRGNDPVKGISKESKAYPAQDANAELQVSIHKRRGQANPTSVSEKFGPEENGDSGFPIESSRGTALDVYPHSGWSMNSNASNSSRNVGSHEAEMRRQGMAHGASQLSRFSNSVAVRGSSKYDNISHQWPEENLNARYDAEEKHDESRNMLAKQQFLDRNVLPADSKDYDSNSRIHYSGPLLPATGNLDEILKEHEKRIQHAVRKSLLDKAKTRTKKSHGGSDQIESLLQSVGNGR